jgi:hypothetical protein
LLHIHPKYEMVTNAGGTCNATGRLLVDDGEVLDYVGLQNRYAFNFSSVCQAGSAATKIVLNVDHYANASKAPSTNANDLLGKVVIYNTDSQNFNMAGNYKVTVAWTNTTAGSSDLPINAAFVPKVNQTVFAGVAALNTTLGLYNFVFEGV